jgi:hypothetical protein
MPTPDLASLSWWKDLQVRAFRNGLQAAVPILVVLASATGTVDAKAIVFAILGAVIAQLLLTVVRAVVAVTPPPGAPLWRQALDRSVPAAVAVIAAALPPDLTGILAIHWTVTFWAAGAAALLALIHLRTDPPVVAVDTP